MEKLPLVSVIIPCYNVSDFVEKCIQSVLVQSYDNLEIIIVNDGSTDDTGEKIKTFLYDERIRYIVQENKGLSGARNTGLDIMKGDYVCFIDSDDFIHKDYVKILYKNLIKTDADISICNVVWYYHNNPINIEELPNENHFEVKPSNEYMRLINYNYLYITAWNKLYKAFIFDDIRYPLGKIHEDEFIAHELYYKVKKVVVTDRVLYAYVQRESSIVNTNYNEEKFLCVMEAYENRYKFYLDKKIGSAKDVFRIKWNYVFDKLYRTELYIVKKYILTHPIEFLKAKNFTLLGRIVILIKIYLGLDIKKK